MHQTPVPPGAKCSISQTSEPGGEQKPVRTISPEDQGALEQAPFFDALCQLFGRWARLAQRESERKRPESNRPVA
jgi:hypothetical protein